MVRSLGAGQVIDYTREDFTQGGERYDVNFNNVENRSLSDVRCVLAPGGTLIPNSGTGAHGLGMLVRLTKPFVVPLFVRQRTRRFLSVAKQEDLIVLKEVIDAGEPRPVIDRSSPLPEVPEALSCIEGGHARGKIVITVASHHATE